MQTPDLEQIQRWRRGEEPLPPDLKEIAIATGDERARSWDQAMYDTKRMNELVPLLYVELGWRNISDMHRKLQMNRKTINEALDDAGIPKSVPRAALAKKNADGAAGAPGAEQP